MAIEVEAGDLEQEYSTKVDGVERSVRVDRVRVRPRTHDGAEMFVVGVQGRGGYGA